jgi:oligopeptide/dipeptide ABC transporter ATP-binding protein
MPATNRDANDELRVDDLAVHFPSSRGLVRAVDGVSFRVGKGEAVGLVGESGSGKSMTSLALMRLVPNPGKIVRGRMVLGERDITDLDESQLRRLRLSEIAMIFQDAGSYLNPIMRIADQIGEAVGRRGSKDPADVQRVMDALKAVQIPDPERVAAAYPHELSGGMQQRVMIASVLIRQPRLIIADEPTTALDATVQHQVLKVLAKLRAEANAAMILISHDLAVISEVCSRVYVMYAGRIVEESETQRLFDDPKHPYTQALVEAVLDPFDPKAALVSLEGTPPDMAAPPSGCRFHPRCRSAFKPCFSQEPPVVAISDTQTARCWLHAAPETVSP